MRTSYPIGTALISVLTRRSWVRQETEMREIQQAAPRAQGQG